MATSLTELDPLRFYSPEEVAPLMNISKTTLRDYCKTSGIHTRLAKNSIMLSVSNIADLHAWIIERKNAASDWTNEPEQDPFK